MLNERSDDDDNLEARAGVRKKSELLHQLLKTENRENEDEKKNDVQSHDDSLLRSLGFPITSSPSPPNGEPGRGRKRPSDDRDDPAANKRTADGSQVLFLFNRVRVPVEELRKISLKVIPLL